MKNFQNIRRLYSIPEEENYGMDEKELLEMESGLNIVVPKVLRTYYLTLGKHELLNYTHNRLLTPEKEVGFSEDRYLVFYEENQGVVYWGIKESDLASDNPTVYGNYCPDTDTPDWHQEAATTEDFLLMMAIINGVLGGLKYNGNCFDPVSADVVHYISTHWKEVKEISNDHQKYFTDNFHDAISLSFDEELNCTALFVGTSDRERFDILLDKLDVDWSYTSDED